MPLKINDSVGRYVIHAEIGEGSFGKVYRAWDPEFERWVAIKELISRQPGVSKEDYDEYLNRFKLERRIQGRFQHPHIISVYDLVQQDENEYLIEEFVGGGTLRDLIQKEKTLKAEKVVQLGVELCQAIAAAWAEDIVHRDIKPSNILLTEEGHARLGDFGVAQMGQMSQRTQSDSSHPGTPAYKSPEQEMARGYLDERSDIYALGLVLYEALSGALYKRERVPLSRLRPDIPKSLERVVMKSLVQNPAERYQHAAEFEEALRGALARRNGRLIIGIGGVLTLIGLIFMVQGYFRTPPVVTPPNADVAATHTPSATPAQTRTATPTSPPSQTPTPTKLSAGMRATSTPAMLSPTPTPTPTASKSPQSSRLAAPLLVNPIGGQVTNDAAINFRWRGELPDDNHGYVVILQHNNVTYNSPILSDNSWQKILPGENTWGEWRWWVAIVQRNAQQDTVARSDAWTFYYDPFGSPLATPKSP